MSLNYSLSKIKDWETVCKDENGDLRPETHDLIFATMVVDMGLISGKGWKKFVNRIKAHENLYGGALIVRRAPGKTLEETVESHIGLSTNVATKHASTYLKKLARIALDRIPFEIRLGM